MTAREAAQMGQDGANGQESTNGTPIPPERSQGRNGGGVHRAK